jgi:hypothetical protein
VALAFWANVSITVQTAKESSASFFERTMLVLVVSFILRNHSSKRGAKNKAAAELLEVSIR